MKNKARKTKQWIITTGSIETQKLGEKLAKKILKTEVLKTAFIIGLEGDLGSGKTTFLQGFAKGLGIREKILSPTFVIMKRFQLNNLTIKQFNNFFHIDCYRTQKPKELLGLDFKEIASNPENIIAIEWADKIKGILSSKTIFIKFKFINRNKRQISFAGTLFK